MKYEVTDNMHIRTAAVLDESNIRGELRRGYVFDAVADVKGAWYEIPKTNKSSNDWLRDANNFYYWKGTTTPYGTAYVPDWWFDDMNIQLLWDTLKTKGENVKVVVWDTGLDENLFGKPPAGGYDFLNDREGYVDREPNLHGTEVARIIAGNQGGIAPDCSLYIARDYPTTPASFKKFANSPIFKNADVINISYHFRKGGMHTSLISEMESSLTGTQTVCASAGNFIEADVEVETWPGAIASVICVGAINPNGTLHKLSPNCKHLTLCAPGSGFRSVRPNNAENEGTSFACAFVSGITALLISYLKKRGLTFNHSDIKNVLSDAHKPNSPTGGRWGNGIIDIETLIEKIQNKWP